jgi:formylglycine-generating enzyme required for sulfatase activity
MEILMRPCVVLLLLVTGCGLNVCKRGTVLLSLAYGPGLRGTRGPVAISLGLTVDESTQTTSFTFGGQQTDTVEITFAKGYPDAMKQLTLTVTATWGTTTLATITKTFTTSPNCTFQAITLDSTAITTPMVDAAASRDMAAAASLSCMNAAWRCDGNTPAQCINGAWVSQAPCAWPTPFCATGSCVRPASCDVTTSNCGPSHGDDCCSIGTLIPGGKFKRDYDGVTATNPNYPATVSPFYLNQFEVTVGRFRKFVNSAMGTQSSAPAEGAGALVSAPGSGWKPDWNQHLAPSKEALITGLNCDSSFQTWVDDVAQSQNENRPINCVTWYEAFAFCVWDGGRLPTEAEWDFAAAGGSNQSAYPWSGPIGQEHVPDGGMPQIDPSEASYYVDDTNQCMGDGIPKCKLTDLVVAGSKPAGQGQWTHRDLAGNVAEWVLDYASTGYIDSCVDCVNLTENANRVLRGGSYFSPAFVLTASARSSDLPIRRATTYGFRCVYPR